MKRSKIDLTYKAVEIAAKCRPNEVNGLLLIGIFHVLVEIADHMGLIEEEEQKNTENNGQES